MAKLNVGIIGCGVVSHAHVKSFQNKEDVEVTWACDLNAGKATDVASQYGIDSVTSDYRKILADPSVDCISICTDHASHASIAVDAMEAGKHVLCEKALAADSVGLDKMISAHRKKPKLVFAGVFQHRFDAASIWLKRLIDEGAFGEILTASLDMRCLRTNEYYEADEWRGTWAGEGGSVLINQAIHFIDILAWIMGGVEAVSGAYANIVHKGVIETEDTATAALRFRSGALGAITATSGSRQTWEANFSISGTLGYLELCNGKLTKWEFEDEDKGRLLEEELAINKNAAGIQIGKLYYGRGHVALIADFVDAVREEREPFISGLAARHAVDIVLGIYDSHKEGSWVTL